MLSNALDDLRPEQESALIGLGWSDVDTKEDDLDGFWALTQRLQMYCRREFIGDFKMTPRVSNGQAMPPSGLHSRQFGRLRVRGVTL